MNLEQERLGRTYQIVDMRLSPEVLDRLEKLGFYQGVELVLCHRNYSGAVVVNIWGTRIALGRRIAENIFIEEVIHE